MVLLIVVVAIVWIERRPIATELPEERVRAARRPGDLSPRPGRPAHPASQQPGHRRSAAARPHARCAHHPDAPQVERQLRGLSRRRPRRAAARPAGQRARQLGPDRQAAAAAQRQAVRAAQFRARRRRQQHRAGDAVRAARRRAAGQRQAQRRLQGARPSIRSPRLVPGRCAATNLRADVAVAVTGRRPRSRGAGDPRPLRLPGEPVRHRRAAVRRQGQLQRELHQHRRQRADGDHDRWSPARTGSPPSSATSPTRARSARSTGG